jgi:HAD superfamily hydrolase (TIGR01490 family)
MKKYAFFDLDETLISCKSLFEVFRYFCERCGLVEFQARYALTMTTIQRMISNNISRYEINKFFYSNFKGISQAYMQEKAKQWFEEKKLNSNFFYHQVLKKLEDHQDQDDKVIVISGSFEECVQLITSHLRVQDYLCIDLEKKEGIYTGRILGEQTIGEGKKRAIERYAQQKKLNLKKNSYAYTDHISDLPMLRMVEYPVVVGNDPDLLFLAKTNSWQIISV